MNGNVTQIYMCVNAHISPPTEDWGKPFSNKVICLRMALLFVKITFIQKKPLNLSQKKIKQLEESGCKSSNKFLN